MNKISAKCVSQEPHNPHFSFADINALSHLASVST